MAGKRCLTLCTIGFHSDLGGFKGGGGMLTDSRT